MRADKTDSAVRAGAVRARIARFSSERPMPAQLYQHSQFLLAATTLAQCPEDRGIEVAIAGRSNVGKSSAVNLICGRKALARVSRTPGRTRELLFFELEPGRRLVDLPGYGYAKAPAVLARQWPAMIENYFAGRQTLAGVLVIMDVRHPLTALDRHMLDFCQSHDRPVHVLLNKADKLARGRALQTLAQVGKELPAAISADLLSCHTGSGREALRERLECWLAPESHGTR